MMKKKNAFGVAVAIAVISNAGISKAATTSYTNTLGVRTIAVTFTQPVTNAVVHIVGVKNKKCTPPRTNVHVMEFIPGSTVKKDYSLSAGLGLKAGQIAASTNSTATTTSPAVFKYSFIDLLLSQVHYNILYTRGGKSYTVAGWLPDAGGGCTYK